jgi:hypothetical protein
MSIRIARFKLCIGSALSVRLHLVSGLWLQCLLSFSFLSFTLFYSFSFCISFLTPIMLIILYSSYLLSLPTSSLHHILLCFPNLFVCGHLWFRKTTTDPHIFACLNIKSGYELYKINSLHLRNDFK